MLWFTLSPRALEQLRDSTTRLRAQLGVRDVGDKVNAMSDAQRAGLVGDLLVLLDECEAILERAAPEAPRKKPLPDPFAPLRQR
jgi:hypothetical protein